MSPFLGIALAAVAVYANSFGGVLVFDDRAAIADNPALQRPETFRWLWETPDASTFSGRPVVQWTFGLQALLGWDGLGAWHAVNLGIHLACAYLLWRLIRDSATLARGAPASPDLAAAVAGLTVLWWAVHPLHTQAVTYIVQRSESLVSLFYLACLFGASRRAQGGRPVPWDVVTVGACWLGMGTKENMIAAPIAVLCYDACFRGGSWRELWQARRWVYAAMAAGWVPLIGLMIAGTHAETHRLSGLGSLEYLLIQTEVIPHYLRMALCPLGQVFDYYIWPPPALGWRQAAAVLGLGGAFLAGAAGTWKRRWFGFPLLLFFLVLGPTSSIVPLYDQAWEYRMYLPLAPVLLFLVAGGFAVHRRLIARFAVRPRRAAAAALGVFAAVVLWHGALTVRRNPVYHAEDVLWENTIAHRPSNARAYLNLAQERWEQGRRDEALALFERGLEIGYRPKVQSAARHNLANLYFDLGDNERALAHYSRVLEEWPELAAARVNRALVHMRLERFDRAAADQEQALEQITDDPVLYIQYAYSLVALKRFEEAATQLSRAQELGRRAPRDLVSRVRAGLRGG